MPLTVVVGGQYGGEGKGLITAYFAWHDRADLLVKIGGPNSAHSFGSGGEMFRVRMIPSGTNLGPSALVFPAGCLIHVDTLFEELQRLGYSGRVFVDPNAGIVDQDLVEAQQADQFYQSVGSTLTGTGYATSRRALRRLRLAREEPRLRQNLTDTAVLLRDALANQKCIIAEGAQAFGLSNYHGEYPYVSSRDTTAGSALAQMGLGPRSVDSIVMVVKCFPTRNRGGDGSLPLELEASFIEANSEALWEAGGGSFGDVGPRRRVALFDFDIVERACTANTPTMLALTGADRLTVLLGHEHVAKHYRTLSHFVARLESRCGRHVGLIASGPYVTDVADRRGASPLCDLTVPTIST